MAEVPVRSYPRRVPYKLARRPSSTPGSLGAIIDDVVSGKRSGYTWTGDWRFDVNDPASMKQVYDKLGPKRHMYVIADTNITLGDRESGILPGRGFKDILIHGPHGVGLWRDDDGNIYADDVRVWINVSRSFAMAYAQEMHQKSILKIDGKTRTFEFISM